MRKKPQKTRRSKPSGRARKNVVVGPVQSADSQTVRLRYPINNTLTGAVTRKAIRWNPNGAYDVDPVLGSTATPGYTEYAAIYSYYRVQKYRIHCEFANLDAFATNLYIYHSNQDTGTTGTDGMSYAQTPFGRTELLSPSSSGGSKLVYNKTVKIGEIVGMDTSQADTFRSTTGAVPADLFWWGFTCATATGSNFVNGVAFNGYVEMTIRFYGRSTLLTNYFPSSIEREADRILFKEQRAAQIEAAVLKKQVVQKDLQLERENELARVLALKREALARATPLQS